MQTINYAVVVKLFRLQWVAYSGAVVVVVVVTTLVVVIALVALVAVVVPDAA